MRHYIAARTALGVPRQRGSLPTAMHIVIFIRPGVATFKLAGHRALIWRDHGVVSYSSPDTSKDSEASGYGSVRAKKSFVRNAIDVLYFIYTVCLLFAPHSSEDHSEMKHLGLELGCGVRHARQ